MNKKCIKCDNEYTSKRRDSLFCSDKCRKALSRTKQPDLSRTTTKKIISDRFKDYGAQDLYDAINIYEHDTWKDSPEYAELMRRLNSWPVDKLKKQGYFVPVKYGG